jgi:hypothetical protein
LNFKDEMKKLTACPIDWETETGRLDWRESVLEFDWQRTLIQCVSQYAVRAEELELNPDLLDILGAEPEPDIVIENLKPGWKKAEKAYKEQAGRLRSLEFQTPSEYGKHFVAGLDRAKTLSRTRNSDSLFFKNYSSAETKNVFWTWFFQFFDPVALPEDYEDLVTPDTNQYRSPQGRFWKKFLHCHHLRICMEARSLIGACEGEETSFVCFDVHIGSKTVHCFPISRTEALKMMGDDGIIFVDS